LIFIVTSLFHIEKKGAFYGLKRKTLKKKEVPVSKPTSKEPELKILNSDVEGNISYQTESIKNLKNDVSILMKSIKDMNDTFMTLKASLDQKDEEISRYKNGYDATIFKNFLLRFARVDRVIKEYSDDNKIDLKGLKDIQIQMDDALSECDVEMFLPEVGSNFKTTIGVADNPEIRKTSDKSKDSIIAEILRPGYRRKLANNTDNEYQIIIAAKVAIYVCE
jgi:molecular chaperone GrpE (heat shock protein)